MATFAKIHVTGPAHIFVGHKTDIIANAIYLGTCEKSPEIETEYMWEDVNNDVAGSAPIDLVLRGHKSSISALFTRFNEDKLLNLIGNTGSRAKRHGGIHQPGVYDSGQIGGLTEYSNNAVDNTGYWLAIKFEFAQNTAVDPTLPKGYWFPSIVPANFTYAQVGTHSKKVQLKAEAHPAIVKGTASTGATKTEQGMATGNYVLRLFTTDPTIFDFSLLPNFN
jgi:hypothetical protein